MEPAGDNGLSCSGLGQKATEQPRSAAESWDTAEHRAGSAHNCHRVPAAGEALGCVSSWIQFKVWTVCDENRPWMTHRVKAASLLEHRAGNGPIQR